MTTVKVGKRTVTLEAPSDYALLNDIVMLSRHNLPRARMAALGACWRSVGWPKVKYQQCQYDPGLYGGKVLNELMERGEDRSQVDLASFQAFDLIVDALIPEEEVETEAGNSEGEEESPIKSSKSNGVGTSTPGGSAPSTEGSESDSLRMTESAAA